MVWCVVCHNRSFGSIAIAKYASEVVEDIGVNKTLRDKLLPFPEFIYQVFGLIRKVLVAWCWLVCMHQLLEDLVVAFHFPSLEQRSPKVRVVLWDADLDALVVQNPPALACFASPAERAIKNPAIPTQLHQ